MTARTVADLIDELANLIRRHQFGLLEVTGNLTGWRTHRNGHAIAELTSDQPATARLRIVASRAAASAALDELADTHRNGDAFGIVTVHGHLTVHPRWGLQLDLRRLRCHANDTSHSTAGTDHPNTRQPWPPAIHTVGLVAPDGGDDARDDVLTHLTNTPLTIIEHRAVVTGPRAALAITHALDKLAIDHRPDITLLVRGGGPASDFAAFNSPLVVAAIDRHPRPIITGLGHANNHTAADDAAHTTCITPTAAAQQILTSTTRSDRP